MRALKAMAVLAGLLLAAPVAGSLEGGQAGKPASIAQAERSFLESWLAELTPRNVGFRLMANPKTGQKLEILWLNEAPDETFKGYRNKQTGEVVVGAPLAAGAEAFKALLLDGSEAELPRAEYEELPVRAAGDAEGKLAYLAEGGYEEAPSPELKDTVVFAPISGPTEHSIVARYFEWAAQWLASRQPACFVVAIDTERGDVDAAEAICAAIARMRKAGVRVVAFVHGERRIAYGAGFMVALACEKIYMSPNAAIGSVLPIKGAGSGGEPDARFMRRMRALAEQGGFPPALAAAMADAKLGVVELTAGERRIFVNANELASRKERLAQETGARVTERALRRPGAAVSLSAEEAWRLGVIGGVAETPRELLELLGAASGKTAIYEPLMRLWRRAGPIFAELRALDRKMDMWMRRLETARTRKDSQNALVAMLGALDEMEKAFTANPNIFDASDRAKLRERRDLLEEMRRNLER